MTVLAPVVLFVYARPRHTKRVLDALLENPEANDTELIVYSDGARDNNDIDNVSAVRELVNDIEGFKSVTVYCRESNYGLADNIIDGVEQVCNAYGKVIVMEDDIVVSRAFLKFMNAALIKYQDEKRVWHISGWNYPLHADCSLPETFLWRVMNCWGWATWSDRWCYFEKSPKQLVDTWDKKKISRFNLDNTHDFWSQVRDNYEGNIDTWAVFWYVTIFSHGGLCLNPSVSYVDNIGHDGSGENCGKLDIYQTKIEKNFQGSWPIVFEENVNVVNLIKTFYESLRPTLFRRIRNRLRVYIRLVCAAVRF